MDVNSWLLEKFKTGEQSRNCRISVIQNFTYYDDIKINIKEASGILLSAIGNHRGAPEVLQSIFISNKKYLGVLEKLHNYNNVRQLSGTGLTDANDIVTSLITFIELNFPEYQKEIQHNINFIKQSFGAFKSFVKEKLDITINLSIGPVIQLN
ncbi:MAG: hypothetical protein V4501_02650, partial [Pseudomonadota bacterium]